MHDLSVEQNEDEYVRSYSGLLPSIVERRLRHVRAVVPPPARCLDFGGGFGYIAERLMDDGYDVTVLEKSRNAVKRMRRRGMRTIESLEDVSGEKFDVITLWHVLEHIADPVPVLQELSDFIKQDGHMIIAVPNADGFFAKVGFEHWIWTLPWHLHYIGERALKTMLARSGLRVNSIETDTGDIAALECLLAGKLLRRSSRLKYQNVEAGTSETNPGVFFRMLRKALNPFSLLVQRIAAALGRGEEIVVNIVRAPSEA
ncbi:MAG: class I SAM-dependent methyltransferase [Candidatus Eremiobacteraeota bacterium]|nr:class I SAM-dependent methyltransferase [Candidatus Eremiobacteraeota bacterium]